MNIFYYDKTFEGLLTVVFDAYKFKLFPDLLLGEDDVSPLFFDNSHRSETQLDKSNRVMDALRKKLSTQAINQLFYVWQSKEPGYAELLFRYIKKVIDTSHSIETNFSDSDVMDMIKLAKKVSKECMYLVQFVRFQKNIDNIYFSSVSPAYDVLPFTLKHFKTRFADQKWIVYDEKRNYGFYYDLSHIQEMTIDDPDILIDGQLNPQLLVTDELLFQRLWQKYFQSVTIKERINLKQQRQHMPKRFWHQLTELRIIQE